MLVHKSDIVFLNLDNSNTIKKFEVLKSYSQEDNINQYSNICSQLFETEVPMKMPEISRL